VQRHIHAVVSAATHGHLDGLIPLAHRLGASHVDMTLFMDVIHEDPAFRLSAADIEQLVHERLPAMARQATARGIRLHLVPLPARLLAHVATLEPADIAALERAELDPALLRAFSTCHYNVEINQGYHCLSSYYDKFMDPFGTLYPCSQSATFHSEYVMGNIQDRPFDEVMNSEALQRFRRQLPDHQACQKCFSAVVTHPHHVKLLPRYGRCIEDPAYFTDNINTWTRPAAPETTSNPIK
jgi:radical SAM protein with 4Fe4S-binding SPASM domain